MVAAWLAGLPVPFGTFSVAHSLTLSLLPGGRQNVTQNMSHKYRQMKHANTYEKEKVRLDVPNDAMKMQNIAYWQKNTVQERIELTSLFFYPCEL